MSILHVRLLGSFSLVYGDSPLATLNTPRLQALLAYLVLHRTAPQFRYHLAYQFWSESTEAQARTNLRNLLHLLLKALPESDVFICSDPQTLQWSEASPFTLDVCEFERLLAPVEGSGPGRESLVEAVNLYKGDLLPSCYADWIIPERERLRQAYLAALGRLVSLAEAGRDYPAALGYAHQLVQADPLDASANHLLIRLHALADDRPAALKAYKTYARKLQRELGVTPDPETEELYRRLQVATPVKKSVSSGVSRPVALIGRQLEWQEIQAAWRTALAGHPHLLFVTGEAGIGKTRLVEELIQWADRQGIRTAQAFCYPAEGSLPYAPVVSWLRSQTLPPLEKIWLAEISRLMPEVLQKNPGLPKPTPLSEAWQRQRLFESLARALLVKRQKLLLVIEDAHWCDQDTLEWLHYLLRFDTQATLLVVATVRSGETDPGHPLAILQTALDSEGKCRKLELKPLSEGESLLLADQVAQQFSGHALDPQAAASIFRESEGNPLFVVEIVRLGQPVTDQGQGALPSVELSDKVQAVLQRRISQLTPPTRELVSLAATLGHEFNLDVLHRASGTSEEALINALDELLQRKIVHEQTPESYDFTHDKLRQATFTGLSTAHRRLLHRRVAEAYLQLTEDSPTTRSAEIASHYERAGLALPAIQYYRLAAQAAASIYANEEAQHYLQHASELVEGLGVGRPNSVSPQDYAGLLERLGDLLLLNGKYLQAQSAFEKALSQSFPAAGIWRSQIYRKICDSLVQQYNHPLAHAALDQAELVLSLPAGGGTQEERQEWIQIQLTRSQLFYWDNHPDQIDVIVHKISPLVAADGRKDQQIDLLSQQYMARLRHERYRLSDETVEIARRRLELAKTLADPYTLAFAQFQLGFGLIWHTELQAAREWLTRGYETAEYMGARLLQVRCLAYLDIVSRMLGDLQALRSQTELLLDLAPAIGEHMYHGVGLANQGWLAWREGDVPGAKKLCQSAIELWNKYPGVYVFNGLANWVLLAIAVSHRELGAVECYAQALLDPKSLSLEEPLPRLLTEGLQTYQAGDGTKAVALFDQALIKAQEFCYL